MGVNKKLCIEKIIKHLKGELYTYQKAQKQARNASIQAPSAMESASDTTRVEKDALSFAYLKNIKQIKKL